MDQWSRETRDKRASTKKKKSKKKHKRGISDNERVTRAESRIAESKFLSLFLFLSFPSFILSVCVLHFFYFHWDTRGDGGKKKK